MDIQKDQVRALLIDELQGFTTIAGFAYNFDVSNILERSAASAAYCHNPAPCRAPRGNAHGNQPRGAKIAHQTDDDIKVYNMKFLKQLTETPGVPGREERVRDWLRYPELRFLDRFDIVVPIMLAAAEALEQSNFHDDAAELRAKVSG